MKKGIILLMLTLLAIPCITLDAARKRKSDSTQVNGDSFYNSDFKKVKRDDAKTIAQVVAAAQGIDNANKRLAKLEEIQKVTTQSDIVNDLILKDLGKALSVFRGYTQHDDAFKAAQRNMKESLDNLVKRVENAKASKIDQETFEALKDAVIAAIYRKALSLSNGESVPQRKTAKEGEVKGWFADVFIMKPTAKPESATEERAHKARARRSSLKSKKGAASKGVTSNKKAPSTKKSSSK